MNRRGRRELQERAQRKDKRSFPSYFPLRPLSCSARSVVPFFSGVVRKAEFLAQGWAFWILALGAAFALPGVPWRGARAPEFPFEILPMSALLLGALVVSALGLAWLLGPSAARSRALALWEAPPELLWGGLALGVWPSAWGPPGKGAWALAFLLAALPTELRWLAQALPPEHPFPAAWGHRALWLSRGLSLRSLLPRWIAARLPLWMTATLVLERILAIRGLGSDWMGRVAAQDRWGLGVWILVYATLWTLAQRTEAEA